MTTGYLGKTVMKEYSNSATLLALLDDFDQWVDLSKFTTEFYDYVWNIDTAQGFGLDIWGRILGQSRYLQIAQTPDNNFGFNALTVAVNGAFFGTGNGTSTGFTLKDTAGHNVTTASGVTVYRQNYQGRQQLYTTPRTNLALQSQAFDNAAWSKLNATVTPNVALAPDGTMTADRLTDNATSGEHRVTQNVTGDLTQTWSGQIFVKAETGALGMLLALYDTSNFSNFVRVNFNNVGGTFVADVATAGGAGANAVAQVTALGNGWYLLGIQGVVNAGLVSGTVRFNADLRGTGASGTGIYVGSGNSNLLWGGDVKQGVLSSYIPTTTAAVTVTDLLSVTASAVTLTAGSIAPVGSTLLWSGTYTASGTNWQPWGQAPFFGGQAAGTVAFPLQDDYYRKLLLVKAAANIASCDCPSINALMRAMFGDRGKSYVGYDYAHPMHIGYHFEFFPTAVEQSIIESGIFPQPAGTIAEFIYLSLSYAPFGFAGGNTGADPKFVTGFNQGPFYQPGAISGQMLNNIGGTFVLDQSQLG